MVLDGGEILFLSRRGLHIAMEWMYTKVAMLSLEQACMVYALRAVVVRDGVKYAASRTGVPFDTLEETV